MGNTKHMQYVNNNFYSALSGVDGFDKNYHRPMHCMRANSIKNEKF